MKAAAKVACADLVKGNASIQQCIHDSYSRWMYVRLRAEFSTCCAGRTISLAWECHEVNARMLQCLKDQYAEIHIHIHFRFMLIVYPHPLCLAA